MSSESTIVLSTGGVEYDVNEAATDISALIAALQEAEEEGATHVVLSSGNYRGAKWQRLTDEWGWA